MLDQALIVALVETALCIAHLFGQDAANLQPVVAVCVRRIAETEFNANEGRFRAVTTCEETGDHKVIARVGGVVVGKGPVLLSSVPGTLLLEKCDVKGEGARRCVAGDTTTFMLHARDGQGALTVNAESITQTSPKLEVLFVLLSPPLLATDIHIFTV